MTTKVTFGMANGKRHAYTYRAWCMATLYVSGEPKTWAFLDDDLGRCLESIIFANEEDAVAFKLKFAL